MAYDPLRQAYRNSPPAAINVDFTEFNTGTGYVEFFLGKTNSENRMSNVAFYSDGVFIISSTTTSDTPVQVMDQDFDADFNRTVILEGEAIANLGIALGNDEDATDTFKIYAIAKLRKYDGSTETEIASATGTARTWNPGAAQQQSFMNQTLNITVPKTTIIAGDSLRLTVEIWLESNGTADIASALCIDPKGRQLDYPEMDGDSWSGGVGSNAAIDISTTTNSFSTSSILVPIKMDL